MHILSFPQGAPTVAWELSHAPLGAMAHCSVRLYPAIMNISGSLFSWKMPTENLPFSPTIASLSVSLVSKPVFPSSGEHIEARFHFSYQPFDVTCYHELHGTHKNELGSNRTTRSFL